MPCNVALSKETVKSSCEGLQPNRAYTKSTAQDKPIGQAHGQCCNHYMKKSLISMVCINETSKVPH